MTYDWHEYLIFSRNLNENPSFIGVLCKEETLKRNVVSRAYYAAFHYSRKYAETQRRSKFPPDDIHSSVRQWFKDNRRYNVLSDLKELSIWRNQCDYDDDIPQLDRIVKSSLIESERIHHYF